MKQWRRILQPAKAKAESLTGDECYFPLFANLESKILRRNCYPILGSESWSDPTLFNPDTEVLFQYLVNAEIEAGDSKLAGSFFEFEFQNGYLAQVQAVSPKFVSDSHQFTLRKDKDLNRISPAFMDSLEENQQSQKKAIPPLNFRLVRTQVP
jgi:hypothetical protein